jgi:hypothetical protein
MHMVRNTDCDEQSEVRNARVRKSVGERSEAQESGRESRRAKSSETRGEVLLVFLVCTGEYIYNVKFLNEKDDN